MNHPFRQLLVRWAILALGVALSTRIVHGITCNDVGALIIVVLLLSFFNAILKPILVLFTLPFIIVTLGLGVLVINALLFLFVGKLVQGFDVQGFWPALGGALVVSITNFVVSRLVRSPPPARRAPVSAAPSTSGSAPSSRPRNASRKSDDVIDI